MAARPKVIYRLNMPSPYIVERFNAITRRGNIVVEGWFDGEREPDRSWKVETADWEFPARYVTSRPLTTAWEVRQARPNVYFSLYDKPAYLPALLAARASGAKTVLRVLKTFDTWTKRRKANEAAKHLVFRLVHAIHTTGPDGEAYARRYGPRRVFAFPEPIDVARFQAGARAAADEPAGRTSLGLTGCVFLYVGRLWRGKGLDYLLDAFETLRAGGCDASLLILGDGIDESHYRERASAIPGVVFSGFVQQADLPRYYGLSDVFVFPTLGDPYGHVVHEAMAASLPVISTTSAGDIRDRVFDGETGFLVAPANAGALCEKMRALAVDAKLRERMGQSGFEVVRSRTNEWWAGEFERMVESLLQKSPAQAHASPASEQSSSAQRLSRVGRPTNE